MILIVLLFSDSSSASAYLPRLSISQTGQTLVVTQEPSHGPDKALSPMPDSDGDLEDVLLISPMNMGAQPGVEFRV